MSDSVRALAVVVAGGRSRRMRAARSKLLMEVGGRTILSRTLEAVAAARRVVGITLVAPAECLEEFRRAADGAALSVAVVPGGAERQDSVRQGLKHLPEVDADVVLIHDAARPFAGADLMDRVAEAAARTGAAVAAAPVVDTLTRVEGGRVTGTEPRERLWAAQTPQGFRLALARELFARAEADQLSVTDDVALAEHYGHPVAVVEASRLNIKITAPEDLPLAEAIAAGAG